MLSSARPLSSKNVQEFIFTALDIQIDSVLHSLSLSLNMGYVFPIVQAMQWTIRYIHKIISYSFSNSVLSQ